MAKLRTGVPQGGGGVDDVQGAVAKAGLPVQAPAGLLLVAVAGWVACACAVAVSLQRQQEASQEEF